MWKNNTDKSNMKERKSQLPQREAELNSRNPGAQTLTPCLEQGSFHTAHPDPSSVIKLIYCRGATHLQPSAFRRDWEHLLSTFSHILPLSPVCHGKYELQIFGGTKYIKSSCRMSLRIFPTPRLHPSSHTASTDNNTPSSCRLRANSERPAEEGRKKKRRKK